MPRHHHGNRRLHHNHHRRARSDSPASFLRSWGDTSYRNFTTFSRTIIPRWTSYYNRLFYIYGNVDINNEDTREDKEEPAHPDPVKVLTVKNVDLQVELNGKAHRTDEYDIASKSKPSPKLVVRRGQPFNIEIDFSKRYDVKKDDLRLVFQAGDNPLTSKGTNVEIILSDDDKPNEWGAKILSREGNCMVVSIFTPSDCFVAKWAFKVDVVKKEESAVNVYQYAHSDPIYILFNPWCKDDSVYMEGEADKKEYVLNESGKIFCGNSKTINSKPWNFGQFESCVLDVTMDLLDSSNMNWAVRGKPVNVVRKISALINSSDDGGVLTGNWTGNYRGGMSPSNWTGSVAILEKFWDTKKSVKFGQCWVFSGLVTSVCRAIGIPSRSVTNFASAHDTDGSITIDVHIDRDGEEEEDINLDSIWNFHVWNEAWMSRTDLPAGYGGWQAYDATPQETSDDIFCCGPTSVRAIRLGEVNLPYDGPFVFAEVNADRVYWMPNTMGEVKCCFKQKNAVGKFISTKKPGSSERMDITHEYKPAEGSAEERAVVIRANHLGSTRSDCYITTSKDVEFSVENDTASTLVGENFNVVLRVNNTSKQNSRTVSGRIVVKTMYYTGVLADKICSIPFTYKVIPPGKDILLPVTITPEEYVPKLRDGCMLDVFVWSMVKETQQAFTTKEDFVLQKPKLTLKGPSDGALDREFMVDVSFNNPLDTTLTECEITIDGLTKSLTFPQRNVGARGTFLTTLPVTPRKKGQKELIVIFASTQLADINSTHDIFIKG